MFNYFITDNNDVNAALMEKWMKINRKFQNSLKIV